MRLLSVFAGLALLLGSIEATKAACNNLAENCVRNGGTRTVCFGEAYRACQKTGIYVGPYSGRTFVAHPKKN
jgi:hypothetical protein